MKNEECRMEEGRPKFYYFDIPDEVKRRSGIQKINIFLIFWIPAFHFIPAGMLFQL